MQRWFLLAAISGLATLLAIAFVDHPVADLMNSKRINALLELFLYRVPRFAALAITVVACLIGILVVAPGGRRQRTQVAICASISLGISYLIVSLLKPVFGRGNPELWATLRIDKFHFLGDDSAYYFFPSGHAAMLLAAATSLWLVAPERRAIAALAALAGCTGLVLLNLHFVSDVTAGGFVGASVAMLIARLWPEKGTTA